MASLTAEIDVTEAHGAMQELVRLADGAAFTTTSQIGLPPLRAIHPEAWRSPLKRGVGGSDPVLTFSPPLPA